MVTPGATMADPDTGGSTESSGGCLLNSLGLDRIYVINLGRRPDRLQAVWKRFAAIGLENVRRFDAIDAMKLGITATRAEERLPPLEKAAIAGVWMSNMLIFREAVENGLQRILVFEDDVTFQPDFERIFRAAWSELPHSWELLYLGYFEKHDIRVRYSKHLALPDHPWGGHAYMAQGSGIRRIHEFAQRMQGHFDWQLGFLARTQIRAFEVYPSICGQSGSSSDVSLSR